VSENYQHGHGDALPAQLERVHQRLLEDGGMWRAEYPPSAAFRQGVEAFQRVRRAQANEPGANYRSMRERDSMQIAPPPARVPTGNTPNHTKRRFLRGLLGVAATVTVAALFAVAFQLLPVSGPAQQHRPTTTPSAGVWENVGHFQSRDGERVAVAPSDPYVVYRLNLTRFTMERSVEGGATSTWSTVALPAEITQAQGKSRAAFDINPLNPNIVYLTAFGDSSARQSCPSPFQPDGLNQRPYICTLHYVSTNGGASWQRLMLPDSGRLTGMLSQVLGSPRAPLEPQGNRVYSLMTTDAYAGQYRLVVSGDGVHWQTCDGNLGATGLRIESYVASPTGSTIWATLSDGGLWRSDDAGMSWTRAASLPQNQAPEMMSLAAARSAAGKSLLYVESGSQPLGDIAPDGVRVSVDGGKTWQSSPVAGVPDGQHAAPHSAMTRSDGTLVMLFRTTHLNIAFDEGILQNAAYYAWKPGATSWTRLTPTFDAEAVQQQWITPANDAKPLESIWALVYRDPTLTYVKDAYVKDGQYTISYIGMEP
jgi:hypothetical protein